jgi:hypothetical protein
MKGPGQDDRQGLLRPLNLLEQRLQAVLVVLVAVRIAVLGVFTGRAVHHDRFGRLEPLVVVFQRGDGGSFLLVGLLV